MSATGPSKSPAARPTPARVPSSNAEEFRRPLKAHTFNGSSSTDPLNRPPPAIKPDAPDAFETNADADNDDDSDGLDVARGSIDLSDLPIELVSLTDSFLESLTSKTHKSPPTIESVSQLFQDFYALASNHVNTHVSALASRQNRANSPAPAKTSTVSRLRAKAGSLGSKDKPLALPKTDTERQMITADELANKKKARKALEGKRVMLEEAVERRLCEGVYNRIYRHRTTQDEAQDDQLRSKTAALALVGIGPVDLGISIGEDAIDDPVVTSQKIHEIRDWLQPARDDLIMMHEKRYPLGKLNHLKAAHKGIVDTIAQFHPSASADEIMPMLIYTLITLAPEHLNVISDINFIQNFRWEPKLTGEAAYCLTNLEAAISFLQTVDLSTLRADELPQGPPKDATVVPGTPKTETFPPAFPPVPPGGSVADGTVETSHSTAIGSKPSPSAAAAPVLKSAVQARNRRFSELVNTPAQAAQALGAASDAVLLSADQSLKNITNSLGDSYKFFLGKIRETQGAPTGTGEALVVPKTLDDARKLVSTPPPDEEGSVSGASSTHGADDHETWHRPPPRDDKVLNLIGGKKAPARDHSADSARSVSNPRKVLFSDPKERPSPTPSPAPSNASGNPLENAVRTFGSSFNPIGRLSSMNVMRGFGRTASSPVAPTVKDAAAKTATEGGDLAAAFPDIAPALPPKETPKIKPPNRRFMELQNPGDLKLGEVLELLRDYRRLATALKDRDAFESK
ncbi:hypothetical protein B0T11DRAFT_125403 [Plectosphaerella cucumerina]|uniref:VPS9 domain-containing protein n=1 Tax=Plectosphaerella cucumerina TaxID=40658 RepID=A0A8K0X235_9PEZI|nr:hypothetical protein B0T11DRAFT_125403 [Plectosphaerella cucumerina]